MDTCATCGLELAPDPPGTTHQPCPRCGATTRAKARAGSMTVGTTVSARAAVRTSLIWQWAEIAVKHEAEAHDVRARGEISNDEMQACMVCVAAVAFALDAIYAEARDVVPEPERSAWTRNGTARWKQIFETLRRAFNLAPGLRDEFGWLSVREELGRDFLVHPDADFRDSADHPLLPNTTAERSHLRAENATRTVRLLMTVLEASLESKTDFADEWGHRNAGVIARLTEMRTSASARPR